MNFRIDNFGAGVAAAALLGAVALAGPASAASVSYDFFDATEFYATFQGHPISLINTGGPPLVGSLPLFDTALGTLTGASLSILLSGTAELLGHSATPFVTFRSTITIYDHISLINTLGSVGIDSSRYTSRVPGYSVTGVAEESDWRNCVLGCEKIVYPYKADATNIEFLPDDLAKLTGTGGQINFQRDYSTGAFWSFPGLSHDPALSGNFLEACIDNCGDSIGAAAAAAYLAQITHVAFYSDAHTYGYMERRFAITYEYDEAAPMPEPVPIPASLPLLAASLLLLKGRRPARPARRSHRGSVRPFLRNV